MSITYRSLLPIDFVIFAIYFKKVTIYANNLNLIAIFEIIPKFNSNILINIYIEIKTSRL